MVVVTTKHRSSNNGGSKSVAVLNVLLFTNALVMIVRSSFFVRKYSLEQGTGDDGPVARTASAPDLDENVATKERNFFEIAKRKGTDKVQGQVQLSECLKDPSKCTRAECEREECRPWGHFYHTIYQSRLGPYSTDDADPFQFLEIGFFKGNGFDTYTEFLPRAEAHSMEISCLPAGRREDGKWPWGNFAEENANYETLLRANRLHCGDASDVEWLNKTWTEKMRRDGDAPPLKVVVDDGAHLHEHMATSVLFWFPRVAPGGLMIVEDVQPIPEANKFRTQFLPQIMADLHYCGDPTLPDAPCFPTLMPLLRSIHCEMHVCVFERNDAPASEPNLESSKLPDNALDLSRCASFQK